MENETKIKKCSKCGKIKLLNEFHKRSDRKNGIRPECKECFNKKRRENYLKHPQFEILVEGFKRCSKCKEVKEFINFGKDNNTKRSMWRRNITCCI